MGTVLRAKKRIDKELSRFHEDITNAQGNLIIESATADVWVISVRGAEGTLYAGEEFKLQVQFTDQYPIESPIVKFVGTPAQVPHHEHVYSNGHICLNILGDDWSPALTVHSVCLSILSMLSSATERKRPPDDSTYSRSKGSTANPKNTKFMYHDDSV